MTHNLSERYVSPEVARLLKEHGFNEVCRCVYRMESDGSERFMEVEEIPRWDDCRGALNEQLPECYISAPTQAMAREWVETVHKLFIEVMCGDEMTEDYSEVISTWFDYDIIPIGKNTVIVPPADGIVTFDEPWKCVEAALKNILTKII